jgi:hypothetical protein
LNQDSDEAGWEEFSEVWDSLLMAMNHVLTIEANITENHVQIWNQLSSHFQTFKEVIINEALHLLRFAVTNMRETPTHGLNHNDQFEPFYENILVILSRNENCFENKFKIWLQLRSILGSFALHMHDRAASISSAELSVEPNEHSKTFIEKEKVLNYCQKLSANSSDVEEQQFDLPFLLYDILVEVFDKSNSEKERKSLYKRAYRVLAPSKETALRKALQFENWVIEGKQSNSEIELYEAEIDRSVENTEKQTLLFLRDLINEEADSGEYMFAGIVNSSAKAFAP